MSEGGAVKRCAGVFKGGEDGSISGKDWAKEARDGGGNAADAKKETTSDCNWRNFVGWLRVK